MCSRGNIVDIPQCGLVKCSTTRRPPSPHIPGQLACVCGVDGDRLTVLSPEGGRPGTREVLKVFVPLDSQRQHASLKSFSMFAVLCY